MAGVYVMALEHIMQVRVLILEDDIPRIPYFHQTNKTPSQR